MSIEFPTIADYVGKTPLVRLQRLGKTTAAMSFFAS